MPRGIGRRHVLVSSAAMLAAPAIARGQGKAGVALVIGNSKYQWEAQLPNVRRDAPDVAKRFQALGLQTELVQDASRSAMDQALAKFRAASNGANFAAFYFAGHGATWENRQYLVPVDSDLSNPETVKALVPANAISETRKEAANHLAVYDACRNNPADGWRQVEAERQIASPERARARFGADNSRQNWLMLFSTSPGRVALDGPPGENSPFAAAFLRHLDTPSVDLQSLPSRLRRDILVVTEGRQVLWDRNSYAAPFSINGNPQPGSTAFGSAGWGRDPGNIIELTKAYAYAHENGLPLPSGLVTHRSAGGAVHVTGSFGYQAQTPIGIQPQLMVVLAVDQSQTAQMIVAGKGLWNSKLGKGEAGSFWRFVTATLNGNRLEYVPRDGASKFMYTWNDANSGRLTMMNEGLGGGPQKGSPSYNTTFTRLDG
jgi:hypothetical protein